jgi:thiol peroxidase
VFRDLPFAKNVFCGAEGLENVINLSDFNSGTLSKTNGLEILDGPLAGLHSKEPCSSRYRRYHSTQSKVPEIANRTKLRCCFSCTITLK